MSDQVQKTTSGQIQAAGESLSSRRTSVTGSSDTFQQTLAAMLMSAGSSGLSGDGSEGEMNIMTMMMMSLLEKILSTQISSETAGNAQPGSTFAAMNGASENIGSIDAMVGGGRMLPASGPSLEPHGRPVSGPVTQYSHPGHVALDFGVPTGTPVRTTMDGKVVYAGWNNEGYGNLVIVENGPYRTYYAHLSKIPVQVGEQVNRGSMIGLSGSTGNSTGPHVHYEIRENMQQINPTAATLDVA